MELFVIYALLWIIVPVVILVLLVRWIVRAFQGKNAKTKGRGMTDRDTALGFLGLAAGTTGLIGVFQTADWFSDTYEDLASFGFLVICGIVLLLCGLAIKQLTGRFLMILGTIILVGSASYIFEDIGSVSAFIVILVAFVALIVAAIKTNKKEHHEQR